MGRFPHTPRSPPRVCATGELFTPNLVHAPMLTRPHRPPPRPPPLLPPKQLEDAGRLHALENGFQRADYSRVHALWTPHDVLLNSSVNLQGSTLVLTKSNLRSVCAAFDLLQQIARALPHEADERGDVVEMNGTVHVDQVLVRQRLPQTGKHISRAKFEQTPRGGEVTQGPVPYS